MWALLLIGGIAALMIGTFELTYSRRPSPNVAGLVVAAGGTVLALVGLIYLLAQDGTTSNWIGGILVAAGVLAKVAGWCRFRYEAPDRSERGPRPGGGST